MVLHEAGSLLHLPGVTRINRGLNAKLSVIANSAVPKPIDEMKRQGIGIDGEPLDDQKSKSVVIMDNTDGRPICRYSRAHPKTGLRWRCSAKVIKNPVTRTMLHECGWHQSYCVGFHMGKAPFLEVPNELGLCPAHYSGRTGKAPQNFGDNWWDIPVMKEPPPKVKLIPRRHKLAPGGLPPGFQFRSEKNRKHEKMNTTNDVDDTNDGRPSIRARILSAVRRTPIALKYAKTRKNILFEWRKRKLGVAAATQIQRIYRNYRVRDKATRLRDHARFEKEGRDCRPMQDFNRAPAHQWLDGRCSCSHTNLAGHAREKICRAAEINAIYNVCKDFKRCRAGAQRLFRLFETMP